MQNCTASSSCWKFPATVWKRLNSLYTAFHLWDTLRFSPYQHSTVPVCLPPALPLLLPLSHQDSGQEWCWKTEWWEMEGSVLPFQRSRLRTCLGWLRRHKPARRAQMQISHRGDACLRWYAGRLYMNQKTCYLMEGSPNSRPTPTAISPEASGQASNICPGSMPGNVCSTLFYLPARAILALASLRGWPRCSGDWGPGRSLFIRIAWRSTTLCLSGVLTSLSLSLFVFLSLERALWHWCLSLLSKGFQKRGSHSPMKDLKLQQFDSSNRCLWLPHEMDLILWKKISLCARRSSICGDLCFSTS